MSDSDANSSPQPRAEPPERPGRARIVIDAMGGDHAPGQIVKGALEIARSDQELSIILVGPRPTLEKTLDVELAEKLENLSILNAEEVIEMDESPSRALRSKRGSTIHVGLGELKDGRADAFISAGNTGAVMAVASLILRSMPGIDRPGIAAPLPNPTGGRTLLIDAGANLYPKASTLYQLGVMGSIYARYMLDDELPSVGLLSIGEEENKGNNTIKEANEILTRSSLNFIGSVDAKLIYRGLADVLVCDGLMGNIVLKTSESAGALLGEHLKSIFRGSIRGRLAYLLIRSAIMKMKKEWDYSEVGGAPLLGVNGAVFIAHGSSDSKSIVNAALAAKRFVVNDVNGHIRSTLDENRELLELPTKKGAGVWDRFRGMIGINPAQDQESS